MPKTRRCEEQTWYQGLAGLERCGFRELELVGIRSFGARVDIYVYLLYRAQQLEAPEALKPKKVHSSSFLVSPKP